MIKNCYKINEVWYYRKKIPKHLNTSQKIYRVSLKKLLSNETYFQSLINNNISSVVNFIDHKLEFYLRSQRGKIEVEDIHQFIQDLLYKYREKAIIVENGNHIGNIGSEIKDIENQRFNALAYYDENGLKLGGHTPKALNKELEALTNAYDTDNPSLIRKKADDILARQSIITREEIQKIPETEILEFATSLVKTERNVIEQDLRNYGADPSINQSNQTSVLDPDMMEVLEEMVALKKKEKSFENNDNWDLLIDKYIAYTNTETEGAKRSKRIDLEQFKDIMMGDQTFGNKYKSLKIIDINSLDTIHYLKEIYKELTNLISSNNKNIDLRKLKQEKGMLYVIEFTKDDRETYPKNKLSGINQKFKNIKYFLKWVRLYDKNKYGSLDHDYIDKLSIKFNELSDEDQLFNRENEKIPLYSEDLDEFLVARFSEDKNGLQNFTKCSVGAFKYTIWSYILGIYTGARSEELAQLKTSDIKEVIVDNEEVYYIDFKVTDPTNQSLKNISAQRRSPLHINIINFGFLNYVQDRIDQKKEWLFDLKPDKDGKRRPFPRNFNDNFKDFYRSKYGEDIKGQIPTYHSLRSHFISKFFQMKHKGYNEFDSVVLKKLIGHVSGDIYKDVTINSYYREGLELKLAKDLINKIEFDLNSGYEHLRNKYFEKIGGAKTSIDI